MLNQRPEAPQPPEVLVIAEPNVSPGRVHGEATKWQIVANDPWQNGKANSPEAAIRLNVPAVASHRQSRLRPSGSKPSHIDDLIESAIHRHQEVACAILAAKWITIPIDIAFRRIQAVPNVSEAPLDHVRPAERHEPKYNVCLSALQVEQAEVGDQLDRDHRVLGSERRQIGRQNTCRKPVGTRDAKDAFKCAVVACQLSLKGNRLLLHALGMREHDLSLIGKEKAAGGALEKSTT